MNNALRTVGAVLAGLVILFTMLMAVELFDAAVYPPPKGVESSTDLMCKYVADHPAWVLAVACVLWTTTAFVSTWVARKIGNIYSGAIVGLLTITGLLMNLAMLPYPMWFKGACVVAIPTAIFAAFRVVSASGSRV